MANWVNFFSNFPNLACSILSWRERGVGERRNFSVGHVGNGWRGSSACFSQLEWKWRAVQMSCICGHILGVWKLGESLRVRELNVCSFCYFYFNMCSNCSREYYFVLVYVCFFCTKVVFLFWRLKSEIEAFLTNYRFTRSTSSRVTLVKVECWNSIWSLSQELLGTLIWSLRVLRFCGFTV